MHAVSAKFSSHNKQPELREDNEFPLLKLAHF